MSKGESKPDYKAGGILMHPCPCACVPPAHNIYFHVEYHAKYFYNVSYIFKYNYVIRFEALHGGNRYRLGLR